MTLQRGAAQQTLDPLGVPLSADAALVHFNVALGLAPVKELRKRGGRLLEILRHALPVGSCSEFYGGHIVDLCSIVLHGNTLALVVGTGAFILTPAHPNDDVEAG